MNDSEIDLEVLLDWLKQSNTLVFCIGNSGRKDDGLGWAFGEYLKQREWNRASIEFRYQLQVEDADLLTSFERVVFVDATKESTRNGYSCVRCVAAPANAFTSHVLLPATILQLAKDLYGKEPEAACLLITGSFWGLEIGLSDAAQENLRHLLESFTY